MLYTESPEPSGSEEEDFEYFYMYIYVLNTCRVIKPKGYHLNKLE